MTIDTSNCNFSSTPLYFTSMSGISMHWTIIGPTNIYSQTQNSFRVVIKHSVDAASDTSAVLYADAQDKKWSINWLGVLE